MSSSRSDAGTTSNMFSALLTWMQESTKPHFIVATCNEISELLEISQGALLRRFDDIFFVDLPTQKEREEIIKIMNERYGTKIPVKMANDMPNWTGAEIERFARDLLFCNAKTKAEMDEVKDGIRLIYNQNQNIIETLRRWAKVNARRANAYLPEEDASASDKKSKRSLRYPSQTTNV